MLLFNDVAEREDLSWIGCKSRSCAVWGTADFPLHSDSDSGRASAMVKEETARLTKS